MPRPLHIANAHIYTGDDYAQRNLYTTDVVVAERPAEGLDHPFGVLARRRRIEVEQGRHLESRRPRRRLDALR